MIQNVLIVNVLLVYNIKVSSNKKEQVVPFFTRKSEYKNHTNSDRARECSVQERCVNYASILLSHISPQVIYFNSVVFGLPMSEELYLSE